MPRFNSICTRILACLVLLLSTGCAQMFNGNLNALVSETELPIDTSNERVGSKPSGHDKGQESDSPDLSNMKIDPLLLQDHSGLSQLPQSARPPSIQQPLIDDTTVVPSYLQTSTAKRLQPIIDSRIEPVGQPKLPLPRQPIILKAMHVEVSDSDQPAITPIKSVASAAQASGFKPNEQLDNQARLLSPRNAAPPRSDQADEHVHSPSTTALPSAEHGHNHVAATTGPDSSLAVTKSNDFSPVKQQAAKSRTPSAIKNVPVAPQPPQPFVAYISAQMQHLVPPFAHHPSIETGNAYPTPGQQPSASVQSAPTSNDFVSTQPAAKTSAAPETPFPALDSSSLLDQLISNAAESTTNPSLTMEEPPTTDASVSNTQEVPPPLNWRNQLEQTIEVFEQEIEHSKTNDPAQGNDDSLAQSLGVLKALKARFIDRDTDTPLTASELQQFQQYWDHQILAINELLKTSSSSATAHTAATQAIDHLRSAIGQLRPLADLKISSPALCKKVQGFGQYTPFDQSAFTSDQEILVYCEIENFLPILEAGLVEKRYLTMLSSSFRISNAEGQIVQEQEFPMVSDHARKIRRDFFMYLPIAFADLPTGHYHLQVTVRDHQSSKEAHLDQPLTFSIR